jgi:two-component system phosphate regulon response regulator PhoB
MDTQKTILVIEDDPYQQQMYEVALKRAGYNMVARGEAQSGLQWLEQILPDLILLDIMLPGISGIDMLKEIRSSQNGQDVPVIVITAKSDISLEDFDGYFISDLLRKPLLPALLIEAIEAALA